MGPNALGTCRRIVLFGGSFDPPHVAHVVLPTMAMAAINADRVAYIPVGRQPFKHQLTPTPAHHRLAMLRLATEHLPHARVLTDEIDRAGDDPPGSGCVPAATYTVDTLERLCARWSPSVELRLLIGADQLDRFHQWRQPDRVIALADPLVMVRPPQTRRSLLASLPRDAARRWEARLIELPRIEVSSTEVRGCVASGRPVSGWLAPAVEDYIRRHGLYR